MTDPIGTTANALAIIGKISAAVRWLVRKIWRRPSEPTWDERPHNFEIKPISFRLDITQAIPSVEVRFYAINHLSRALTLNEVKVTQLQLYGGPAIEQIPLLQEFTLQPKNTVMIVCRRNLLDSESRAVTGKNSFENASFSLVARAKDGRREYTYGPVASMSIDGWINQPRLG